MTSSGSWPDSLLGGSDPHRPRPPTEDGASDREDEDVTDQPVAHCESCAAPLYRGQAVIEGNITHDLTVDPPRSRRTFYCSQDCADA
jgi:hypothetical protein